MYLVFNNKNMEIWFLASSFVGRNSVLVLFECLKNSNRLLDPPGFWFSAH